MRGLLVGSIACATLSLAACATTDPYAEGALDPGVALDCRHIEGGPVTIMWYNRRRGRSMGDQLRAMGYDGWTDVRNITETYRDSAGNYHERVIGQEGVGWRYADPRCRFRR